MHIQSLETIWQLDRGLFDIKINAINQCVFTTIIMAFLSLDEIIRKLYYGSRV